MQISVCIATYNGEKYIKEQILSILPQLSETDEIIISDDGSKDNTISILQNFNDNRIKVFFNNAPHGVVPNFENAIKHATGKIIFLSDQDDIWMPHKVATVMNSLKNYDFAVHNAEIINGENKQLGIDFFSFRHTKYGYWQNLWKMRYLGCTMAFKKEVLKDILPFPKKILWHDMWIAAILHLKYKGLLINEPLIYYRRHGDNASPSGEKSGWSWSFRLKYRWIIFYNSILRLI